MTRRRDDIRILPSAALTVTLIALIAFVTLHPRAAMWACVVALVLAVGGLFTLAKEALDLRAELAAERAAREETAQQLAVAETEARIATELLAQREADARRAGLHAVPTQCDPEHDHLAADDDWFARLYDDKGNLR